MRRVIHDLRPFNLIGREGFKCVVGALSRNYELPPRRFFRGTMLDEAYQIAQDKLPATLQGVGNAATSLDLWNPTTNSASKIGIMAHCYLRANRTNTVWLLHEAGFEDEKAAEHLAARAKRC